MKLTTSFILLITGTLLFPGKCNRLLDAFQFILENANGPSSEGDQFDPSHPDTDDLTGVGQCARIAGCKTIETRPCSGSSGTSQNCDQCFNFNVSNKNVMRADFYNVNVESLSETEVSELVEFMYLRGEGVAISYQGAPYKKHNVTKSLLLTNLRQYYTARFCGTRCAQILKKSCLSPNQLHFVRDWCINIFNWIEDDIPRLTGPPSYVLFLAARLTDNGFNNNRLEPVDKLDIVCTKVPCEWPTFVDGTHNEENAVLVAAALSSVFLTPNWFSPPSFQRDFDNFGFAVQHSLWLAIFAGRLRITLQKTLDSSSNSPIPLIGRKVLCNSACAEAARNYEGNAGTVYASLAALFANDPKPNLRFRPEIHVPHALGCVERTSGMVFVRPGDWVNSDVRFDVIGSKRYPVGMTTFDNDDLTTFELTDSGLTLFPPSIAVSLKDQQDTMCTDAVGNGKRHSWKFFFERNWWIV